MKLEMWVTCINYFVIIVWIGMSKKTFGTLTHHADQKLVVYTSICQENDLFSYSSKAGPESGAALTYVENCDFGSQKNLANHFLS